MNIRSVLNIKKLVWIIYTTGPTWFGIWLNLGWIETATTRGWRWSLDLTVSRRWPLVSLQLDSCARPKPRIKLEPMR